MSQGSGAVGVDDVSLPGGGVDESGRDRPRPWLAFSLSLAVTWWVWIAPIADIDSYWHVLVGQHFLSGGGSAGPPDLTYGPFEPDWRSTQVGSEIAMTWVHAAFGWTGMTVFRLVVGTVLLSLAFVILVPRSRRTPGPMLVYLGVWSSVTINAQERPALVGLIAILLTGVGVRNVLRDSRWLPGWALVTGVWLWAWFHGSWFLGLGLWMVLTAFAIPRDPWRQTMARLGWAALAGVVVCFTPAGTYVWVAQWQIPAAARIIRLDEWQVATTRGGAGMVALVGGVSLLLALTMWAAGPRPAVVEVAIFAALFVSSVAALRMIPVSLMVSAPVLSWRSDLLWLRLRSRWRTSRISRNAVAQRWRSARWRRWTLVPPLRVRAIAAALVIVLSASTTALRLARLDPITTSTPRAILAAMKAEGVPLRVFNDYNLGGRISALSPPVRPVIDGRADRYPLEFLKRYQEAGMATPSGVGLVSELGSTDALLADGVPLISALVSRGWTRQLVDNGFVWLRAPTN